MRSRTSSSPPCSTGWDGRIELGPGGLGAHGTNGRAPGIEAPYLQLVMQRLWDVERTRDSLTLRAATLAQLGGAGQVVADHLERAIEALTPEQRGIAAQLFDHLVTPSGMKIAHEASDLALFAHCSEDEVRGVVGVLADHRILRRDESGRWEIFHDVLAAPCSVGRAATTPSGPSSARAPRPGGDTAGSHSSPSVRSSRSRG